MNYPSNGLAVVVWHYLLSLQRADLWIGEIWQYVSVHWPLQWRHNGPDGASNHQLHHCLLSRLFRRRSKKTSKFCVTVLCVRNSPVTGEFPTQMASNAENVSMWWRHHGIRANYNHGRISLWVGDQFQTGDPGLSETPTTTHCGGQCANKQCIGNGYHVILLEFVCLR